MLLIWRHGRSGIGPGGSALYSSNTTEQKRFTLLRGFFERQAMLAGPAILGTIAGAARALAMKATTDAAYRSCDRRAALSVVRVAAVVRRLVGAKRHRTLLQLGQSRPSRRSGAAADLAVGVDGPHRHAGLPHGCGHRDARLAVVSADQRVGLAQVIVLNRRLAGVVEW